MKLSNMFKKTSRRGYISLGEGKPAHMAPEVPEGLLKKCNVCKSAILTEDVKKGYYICPKCQNYFRVHAMRRIEMVADADTFEEWDKGLTSGNPLHYKGYEEKVEALQEKTGLDEAVVTGKARIAGNEVVLAVCDGRFMMASMGKVVGEKITRAVEKATGERLPIIIFACSGGARMQEGIHSLMQMAKTSAALKRHHDAGCLYVSVLTDPTTGGVTASFAMLGDIILAEPGALIGFAGPRVIEQTIGQKLPKGFQRAEFLQEHGFVDRIVERPRLRETLAEIVAMHKQRTYDLPEVEEKETQAVQKNLTPWERVQLSRDKARPVGAEYIEELFTDFMEFHGDRYYQDDKAIIGGIARFHGMPVTVIAQAIKYISLKDISARQNISIKYLEQIVTPLHRAGLVRSVRGAQGGYRLSRKADKYTAGEILRAIEGSFAPIACLETPENECERYHDCATVGFWEGMYKVISDYVDSVTLKQLIDEHLARRCPG